VKYDCSFYGVVKTLKELIKSTETTDSNVNWDDTVSQVIQDSRLAKPGSLFVAIRGSQSDGHQFVSDVLSKGSLAVVENSFTKSAKGLIKVSSTREILGEIASRFWGHPTQQLKLIGVTGTNGKTTTTFLLDQVFNRMGLKTGLLGTVHNKIESQILESNLTTPGALELQQLFHKMVQHKVDVCSMEVSSIALDQSRPLGSLFQIGVFTNFTQDHLDYHKSMEQYFEAKMKLFRDYTPPCVVINLDDPKAQQILAVTKQSRQLTFSLKAPQSSFHVTESSFGKRGTRATIGTPKGVFELQSPLIGAHNLHNILCVLAVVEGLELELSSAISALADATGAPGRLERAIIGEYYPNVFVDYAHSHDALENVLRALQQLRGDSKGKIITVFGCGGDRDRGKRPKMASVASRYSNVTIVTSDNPRTEDPQSIIDEIEIGIDRQMTEYYREVDRRQAIYLALKMAQPEDMILIAGKGHETYQIIGNQKQDFDDKCVVKDYYNS
jgi:UDP-N-acetylmuramoyl-L-alanyl-D-glutamate--2,6-diaminopimelate ligase